MTDPARDHYVSRFAAFAEGLGDEAPFLAALRPDALASFREQGFPHRKLEDWRYTNTAPLAAERFELPDQPFELAESLREPNRQTIGKLALPVYACGLYVFVDGRFAPGLSATRALAGAPRVASLAELRRRAPEELEAHLGRTVDWKRHPFAALNSAFLDDGAVVRLPEGCVLEQPLHVVFVSTAATVRHPRLLVVAGPGSRATVIEDHVSAGDGAGFTNAVTEVEVGAGASLDLVVLERPSDATYHVGNLAARVDRDARFDAHTLTLSGRLVRNDAEVLLADEGADCGLSGLFLGDGRQVIDNHTLVDHAMPHGTSRELYKGILGGKSRGVFRGRVVVRPDAQKTNATQSNPNLLLADGAEIDTKPQLEIYADDVKCSHGSAIGQLDEDALFYLRARGIGESRARDLLTSAFAAEILEALPLPALAEELSVELLDRLHARPEEDAS